MNGGGEKDLTARVRALYEDSAVPVREIAGVAGVTERTIYKYAAKQDWKPRYAWMPDGSRPPGAKSHAGERFAPVKGAGGRFIRREDKGKPFATGLKATDPAAAARAAGECAEAERLALQAQAGAEAVRLQEQTIAAINAVNRALGKLIQYREERAKARGMRYVDHRSEPSDDMERALVLSLQAAVDWWQAAQVEQRRHWEERQAE